ncbi:hypothetical protein V6N11_077232 [Hibiscus sabdariffa]|uniref:Uncharacterized protein n=1 Tax=Hibiscus sabdariffa TaxID=183260 RepID=A0ABR2TD93_9ROSI
MIEELLQVEQALKRQGHVETRMDIPKTAHGQLGQPNGGLEARGGLEEKLLHALEVSGGLKIQVDDFHGKLQAEGYLDRKATEKN